MTQMLRLVLHLRRCTGNPLANAVKLVSSDGVLPCSIAVHPKEQVAGSCTKTTCGQEPCENHEQGYRGGDEHRAEYDQHRGGHHEQDDCRGEGEAGENHEGPTEGDSGGGFDHLVRELLLRLLGVGLVLWLHLSH